MPKIIEVDVKAVNKAIEYFNELEKKQREKIAAKEAIFMLLPQITHARQNLKYSYEDIVTMLNKQGIIISLDTLLSYIATARKLTTYSKKKTKNKKEKSSTIVSNSFDDDLEKTEQSAGNSNDSPSDKNLDKKCIVNTSIEQSLTQQNNAQYENLESKEKDLQTGQNKSEENPISLMANTRNMTERSSSITERKRQPTIATYTPATKNNKN